MKSLNIFYEEPDSDRWLRYDRHPRRILRRLIRGKPQPSGMMRFFLNLCKGLNLLNVPYRVNDYRYIRRHPEEVACIIGRPHMLDKLQWTNPIVFGSACYSHPSDNPHLLDRLPIRKILVPCEWMQNMCKPAWGDKIAIWPAGIDTACWKPAKDDNKEIDMLLYDKIRWEHDRYEKELIEPIKYSLEERGLTTAVIRYGYYRENEYHNLIEKSRSMLFLCEHETQGVAYQQALSCGVPILAWDRGGFWQDPVYYPDRVKFEPVSSVPYWDDRCGIKFQTIQEFPDKLEVFLGRLKSGDFSPRDYILENLTLEKCAQEYLEIIKVVHDNN